jgi:hypothetical protein
MGRRPLDGGIRCETKQDDSGTAGTGDIRDMMREISSNLWWYERRAQSLTLHLERWAESSLYCLSCDIMLSSNGCDRH